MDSIPIIGEPAVLCTIAGRDLADSIGPLTAERARDIAHAATNFNQASMIHEPTYGVEVLHSQMTVQQAVQDLCLVFQEHMESRPCIKAMQ
jgi:hypothetical protein